MTLLWDGNAETADMSMKEKKLRKYARYALIQEHILKEKQRIIKPLKKYLTETFMRTGKVLFP